ncbi:MAG TPA: hypothetical protein VKZ84_02415 [Bacteriovoracaceae bacterium]|nr:hypothetical protein [Bacteriovoracaceae bacterium]
MNNSIFKKLDLEVFQAVDKLKSHPNYQSFLDFYTNLEDEQQKLFKTASLAALIILPLLLLSILFFKGVALKSDFEKRVEIYSKANEILSKNQGVRQVSSNILSQNPIDSSDMVIAKISSSLAPLGVDLNKIRIANFESNEISSSIISSQAEFSFSDMSVNELMDTFNGLIRREKFRIESVQINRNENTNLLRGNFLGIHYSVIPQNPEE